MCFRGLALLHATTLACELGDLTRFDSPGPLMSFVGLMPTEDSSGKRRRQGAVTKSGNSAARRALVEAAWQYRLPARTTPHLRHRSAIEVNDRRRQGRWRARGASELPPSVERKSGAAVRLHRLFGTHDSAVIHELLCSHPDVACDLPQKNGRNVPATMIRDSGPTAVGVTILHVRTSLAYQCKTEHVEDSAHLARLEYRKASHCLPHLDGLCAHKLSIQKRLSLLEQHAQHLFEIAP